MKEEYKLSHLKELEAESIHIIREVARILRLWCAWPKRRLLPAKCRSR